MLKKAGSVVKHLASEIALAAIASTVLRRRHSSARAKAQPNFV